MTKMCFRMLLVWACLTCVNARGGEDLKIIETKFPHVLSFELGEAEFAPGDRIRIEKLRGTKSRVESGGAYWVEGSYTLTSRPEAELALFATVRSTEPVPTDRNQIAIVKKGSGRFRLEKTMEQDGYLHVSYYPTAGGDCFGGVYFGQGKWVLRAKGFSYLDLQPQQPNARPEDRQEVVQVKMAGPNRAIFEYLGEPVSPPASMDPRYNQTGVSNAVRLAAQRAGISLKRILIDDSEYPFLVALNCADGEFPLLERELKKLDGYEYQGSVGWSTAYAINIVPWASSPEGAGQRVSRRSTLRQAMLYDRLNTTR